MRTSSRQRVWGPTVEQPIRMQKKCCYGQRNIGLICGSLSPSPTHLSHTTNINPFATLSRIKCESYIFIKKCFRLFIEVVIMFLLTSACIWVYNIYDLVRVSGSRFHGAVSNLNKRSKIRPIKILRNKRNGRRENRKQNATFTDERDTKRKTEKRKNKEKNATDWEKEKQRKTKKKRNT